MERRKNPRFAVNLQAALIHDQAMPLGCRVRDVSTSGMLLQCERQENAKSFHAGDNVEVRLSFKHGEDRKGIPVPTIVRRVEENGIGVDFLQPQTHLMTLLEPYLLDREKPQTAAVTQDQLRVAGANTTRAVESGSGTRADRRRFAIRRARAQLAESLQTTQKHADAKEPPAKHRAVIADADTGTFNRRLFYLGLASLVAAVAIVLVDYVNRGQTEHRLAGLESAFDRQVIALASLRAQFGGSDARPQDLAGLSERVETLATSFASLEARLNLDTGQTEMPMKASAPGVPEKPAIAPKPANNGAITRTPAKSAAPAQPDGASDKGPWVINLVSLYDENAADEFTRKARSQGVRADANPVAVKDKQVWRVQVSGFPTREEASAYAETSKQKLGLNSVWIFKQ